MELVTSFVSRIAIGAPGFLAAIVFHEAAHALMAYRFGDPTAKLQGRLSLNPAVHYDLVGTVIFPLVGALLGGVIFGWARPVPIDPRNFKNIRSGIFWVSFAGPLANIILAVLAAFLLALLQTKISPELVFHKEFGEMLYMAMIINIVIAVFNLIPFPPLDGSKMVATFLDYETARKYENLQRYSFLFIIVILVTPLLSFLMTPALQIGNGMFRLFINLLA